MDQDKPISEFSGEFRWLSNFWPAPVTLDGVEFPSVEHAYQAAKTLDPKERAVFLGLTAGQAKRAGRGVTARPDWDEVKLEIMLELVWQKFTLHQELHERLLATEGREIIEGNQWGDTFWGVSRGVGENNLGKIIMQVRDELMHFANAEPEEPVKQAETQSKGKRNLRVLVCGGRRFALDPARIERELFANPAGQRRAIDQAKAERAKLFSALDHLHAKRVIEVVITGAATGADSAAIAWAEENGLPHPEWPITSADWETHGKRAGYLRNMAMLREGKPDVVVAFPGGNGTVMMIGLAQTAGVPVWEPLKVKPNAE